MGAKRLLEASGLGYFRVSGQLDHYSVFFSGEFRCSPRLPVSPTTRFHLIFIDTNSSQAGSLCETHAVRYSSTGHRVQLLCRTMQSTE